MFLYVNEGYVLLFGLILPEILHGASILIS